jgi:dienelactone hydrolase
MHGGQWVRAAVGLALVVMAAACSSSGSGKPASKPTTTAAATPPYRITRVQLTFVDHTRSTPRNGSYPGAKTRTLPTLVSIPVGARRPLPLVVFSTGIDGTATNYAGLYDHWVRAGYAVAAPVFPLSNQHAPGGSTIADFASQPGDVRFVLTELLKQAAAKSGPLSGVLDPQEVALAGKSLGALTTLRAAYLVADHETRERAVISLTGGGDASPQFFTGITVPLLLEHGDHDHTVPYRSSVDAFNTAEPPKFLVTLFGQDHGGAFDGEPNASATVVENTTLDFLDAYVRNGDTGLAKLEHDGTVAKVASIRSDAGS